MDVLAFPAAVSSPVLVLRFCSVLLHVSGRKAAVNEGSYYIIPSIVREYRRDFPLDWVWKSKVFFSVEIDELCLIDVRTV